jgi:hypothetical protein
VAGRRYQAAALLLPKGCTARVRLIFCDISGFGISGVDGAIVTASAASDGLSEISYTRSLAQGVAPLGTVTVLLRVTLTGNGSSAPYLAVTQTMVAEAPGNATEVGAWMPGGLTEIAGGMIRANTITAGQIAANAITSDKITANAITAGKIAAAAISSSQIAAGEIRAVNLASETLITQSAQLGTATVTTLKIGTEAVTLFAATSRGDEIVGSGSTVNAMQFTVTSPDARNGMIFCYFAMAYPGGGNTEFYSEINVNGTAMDVIAPQALGQMPSITHVASASLNPGSNTIIHYWGGPSRVLLSNRTFILLMRSR